MRIETFEMERMQCLYENEVEYNLSESGVEPMRVEDLFDDEDAARRFLSTRIGYPWSAGSPTLREQIASFYPGASPENVTVTNGGAEANFVVLWSLLDRAKGDRLAFMVPNYMQGWGLGRHFGAGSDAIRVKVHRTSHGRRWGLDLDQLDRAVTRQTKAILVTNPNNPTGGILTEEEMDAVVSVARRSRAWLISDEIYRGAELDGRTTETFWGRYDKVIVTSGLSKAFALPGLRVGWVVAPPKVIDQVWRHHDYTTLTPGALSERLGTTATEPTRREAIFGRTRSILRANLPVLAEWIEEQGDVLDWIPPLAGAIAYVSYDLPVKSGPLVDRMRREQSVLVVPGSQFAMGKYLRIGYGSEPDELRKGLERVGRTLRAVANGSS
jgi:aspartate/methionine/tyrosine aminotransferase